MTLRSHVDHLVIAASSLDAGMAWCRETLGIEPSAGGEHALMGTHNRVFRIATDAYPRAYFEVIAINPSAPAPSRRRWFDMDDQRLRAQLARGPRIIHFVANTSDVSSAVASLRALDIDSGRLVALERATPAGMLRWTMSIRDDGARLFDGTLPTLIEWESRHPADSLPDSGVTLRSLEVSHPEASTLQQAFGAIALADVAVSPGPANIVATLATPKGIVRLESAGT